MSKKLVLVGAYVPPDLVDFLKLIQKERGYKSMSGIVLRSLELFASQYRPRKQKKDNCERLKEIGRKIRRSN